MAWFLATQFIKEKGDKNMSIAKTYKIKLTFSDLDKF